MASIRKREWTSRGQARFAWVVDYADQSGKRRLKTFATRKDADDWAITALHEVRRIKDRNHPSKLGVAGSNPAGVANFLNVYLDLARPFGPAGPYGKPIFNKFGTPIPANKPESVFRS